MAAALKKFEGEWQEYKSENFDKYLDAADVGMIKKGMATKLHPLVTFGLDGETINITMKAGPKEKKCSFKLGDTFDFPGEMEGTAVASYDEGSGKMTIKVTPKDSKGKMAVIVREIVDGELVQTMSIGDVTCKRYFKAK